MTKSVTDMSTEFSILTSWNHLYLNEWMYEWKENDWINDWTASYVTLAVGKVCLILFWNNVECTSSQQMALCDNRSFPLLSRHDN